MGGGSADKKTRKSSCAVSANNSNCRSNFGNLLQKKNKKKKWNRKKEEHDVFLKTEKVSKTRIKKTKPKIVRVFKKKYLTNLALNVHFAASPNHLSHLARPF